MSEPRCICRPIEPDPPRHLGGVERDPACPVHAYLGVAIEHSIEDPFTGEATVRFRLDKWVGEDS